jgi:hypothetical protein
MIRRGIGKVFPPRSPDWCLLAAVACAFREVRASLECLCGYLRLSCA